MIENGDFFLHLHMMKKLILLFLSTLFVIGAALARGYDVDDIPNPQLRDKRFYTANPDGILTRETETEINRICHSLRERGLAQIAVVAVDEIQGEDVFTFAIDLFRKWGVGGKQSNNGLGILLVKQRHEIRFVTGDGLEGILPDIICKRIQMKYMLPAFRQDDYNRGMLLGVSAAGKILEGGQADLSQEEDWTPLWTFGVISLTALFILGLLYLGGKQCPRCNKLGLKFKSRNQVSLSNGSILYEDSTYVCKYCGHVVTRRRKIKDDDDLHHPHSGGTFLGGGLGGFGGGGFGGGGFGGGGFGGGFSGGSFGGGGAGSKW